MNCDSVLESIPLYFYGELAPPQEDEFEEHLHACPACAREMERQRAFAAALAGRQIEPPAAFLEECRHALWSSIDAGAAVERPDWRAEAPAPPKAGPWRLFLEALADTFSGLERFRVPVGAAAMLALGFVAARVTTPTTTAEPAFHAVRSVEPDGSGHVAISLDEIRRRTVTGSMDDRNIQQLLLAAAQSDNPAARLESMGVLKDRVESSSVRDALLNAAAHDPNPSVRMKALEGLKPLSGEPDVRKVLSQVLLSDDNPAIRVQVVDMLVAHQADDMVGVLQDLMQREDNSYVRMKSEQALKAMNASIGTF
ncbi:MAG TPA: HEAT repeat domain-containing protein [Bryobacteraceae bacterium]|nr:HEAT repeat domain-containing protein [Bryobacteraceae bacterium]